MHELCASNLSSNGIQRGVDLEVILVGLGLPGRDLIRPMISSPLCWLDASGMRGGGWDREYLVVGSEVGFVTAVKVDPIFNVVHLV
jgi:hypothetical protein